MEDEDFDCDDDEFESDEVSDETEDLESLDQVVDESRVAKTPQQQLENRRRIEAILERKRMRKDLGDEEWDFEE